MIPHDSTAYRNAFMEIAGATSELNLPLQLDTRANLD